MTTLVRRHVRWSSAPASTARNGNDCNASLTSRTSTARDSHRLPSPLRVSRRISGTAERHGVVNRALPDAELNGYVEKLAGEIAGYDRQALAEANAFVDHATLPADTDLVTAYETFFRSVARRAA